MLKLARRARGHFVTLIEIRVLLIRVKPGHISTLLVKNCSLFGLVFVLTVSCFLILGIWIQLSNVDVSSVGCSPDD